jgi:hypothetical protein
MALRLRRLAWCAGTLLGLLGAAAHPDEIAFSPAGVTLADGSTRPTWDVVLHHQR